MQPLGVDSHPDLKLLKNMFNNKSLLITGANGSFGRKAVEVILKRYSPRRLAIFFRDKLKPF